MTATGKADKKELIQYSAKFLPEEMEALRDVAHKTNRPMIDVIRRGVEHEVKAAQQSQVREVALLGYIPAGPAARVRPMPSGTTIKPPFRLDADCYGLLVTGDSMESDTEPSIPDGSYAFFCPDRVPLYGSPVHVEWPGSDDEHEVTVKRYCPHPDGSVSFEPLNKKHKPIVRQAGTFHVRGVFVRAWDGVSG